MPTYVYEVIMPDGSAGEQFEVVQRMSEPALAKHPQTGKPVRRVIQAPIIYGENSDHKVAGKLSDKNLDRLGFTKYQRAGDGKYEKRAGSGPSVISAD